MLTFCLAMSSESSFKIEGMVCEGGCSYKVKSIVNSIKGVNECSLDFGKKVLTVNYDSEQVSDQLIIEKISEDSHKVVIYSEDIFGGKAAIVSKNESSKETQIDLELLFNGIIQKQDLINNQFKS